MAASSTLRVVLDNLEQTISPEHKSWVASEIVCRALATVTGDTSRQNNGLEWAAWLREQPDEEQERLAAAAWGEIVRQL